MNPLSVEMRWQGCLGGCLLGLLTSPPLFAAGQVSSVQISEQAATPFSYNVDGISYNWGSGNNQLLDGFTSEGRAYTFASNANQVFVQRDDVDGVASGEPCGIFVERLSDSAQERNYAADFPRDGSAPNNCDLESLLESRVINRGLLDTFSNTLPDAKNIERLDYVFFYSAIAPLTQENLDLAGHIASDKRGNNPVKMSAILSLDVFGQPAEYGPMVLISTVCSDDEICFGETNLMHTYSFLQNEFNAPQSLPVETERSIESVNMAFVSTADLGLSVGQRYFGISIFADDVDASLHNLTDPTTFPNDTSDDNIAVGDDADIYGGLSGFYLGDELNVISGDVFFDMDGDGVPDADEAGITDAALALFNDVNGDGVIQAGVDLQLGDTVMSDIDGSFVFPGPPDGNYIVSLDESDSQIPPGLSVAPGTNPQPVVVAGIDPDPVNFAFVQSSGDGSDDGTGDGSDDGTGDGSDDGTGDGSDDGTGDGSEDGTGDGSGDGTGDGSDDGTGDGSGDGTGNGSGDGTGDGTDDGSGDELFGDDGIMAEPDSFPPQLPIVNQGQVAELDVLANDDDGTGNNNLTIVNVTESENATITVITNSAGEQVLSYQSDQEYYSPEGEPDTFMYTIEDEDGTRQTGNVSVTVNQFSDVDGNLINDFQECECTELFLETGVDGTGVGYLSRWLMLSLILLLLPRLHNLMRKRRVFNALRVSP